MPEPLSGPLMLGPYQLIEQLAQGAYGEVYRARHIGPAGFQRILAVKRLKRHVMEDPAAVRAFENEARIGGLLLHHNIAQTIEFGQHNGEYYLAMEYVEGLSFLDIITFHRRIERFLPVPIVLELIAQSCDGLHYAHDALGSDGATLKLVHRDIKPSNLMLTRSGVVKVMDFGIARVENQNLTDAGFIKGTPRYLCPEVVGRHAPIDRRSDLFSLGAVLYELLVLRPLFDAPNLLSLMTRIREADVSGQLRQLDEQHQPVGRVFRRLLTVNPEERYQTGREMARDLRQLRRELESEEVDLEAFAEQEQDLHKVIRSGGVPPPLPPATVPAAPKVPADLVPAAHPSASSRLARPDPTLVYATAIEARAAPLSPALEPGAPGGLANSSLAGANAGATETEFSVQAESGSGDPRSMRRKAQRSMADRPLILPEVHLRTASFAIEQLAADFAPRHTKYEALFELDGGAKLAAGPTSSETDTLAAPLDSAELTSGEPEPPPLDRLELPSSREWSQRDNESGNYDTSGAEQTIRAEVRDEPKQTSAEVKPTPLQPNRFSPVSPDDVEPMVRPASPVAVITPRPIPVNQVTSLFHDDLPRSSEVKQNRAIEEEKIAPARPLVMSNSLVGAKGPVQPINPSTPIADPDDEDEGGATIRATPDILDHYGVQTSKKPAARPAPPSIEIELAQEMTLPSAILSAERAALNQVPADQRVAGDGTFDRQSTPEKSRIRGALSRESLELEFGEAQLTLNAIADDRSPAFASVEHFPALAASPRPSPPLADTTTTQPNPVALRFQAHLEAIEPSMTFPERERTLAEPPLLEPTAFMPNAGDHGGGAHPPVESTKVSQPHPPPIHPVVDEPYASGEVQLVNRNGVSVPSGSSGQKTVYLPSSPVAESMVNATPRYQEPAQVKVPAIPDRTLQSVAWNAIANDESPQTSSPALPPPIPPKATFVIPRNPPPGYAPPVTNSGAPRSGPTAASVPAGSSARAAASAGPSAIPTGGIPRPATAAPAVAGVPTGSHAKVQPLAGVNTGTHAKVQAPPFVPRRSPDPTVLIQLPAQPAPKPAEQKNEAELSQRYGLEDDVKRKQQRVLMWAGAVGVVLLIAILVTLL